jgi:hypothetical protein
MGKSRQNPPFSIGGFCQWERSPMSLSSAKNYALRAARSQDEKEAIELLSKAILELAASIEATDSKLKQINKSKG